MIPNAAPLPSMDLSTDGEIPEWVHLLPAGEIRTFDGRGPYRVNSMQAIASQLAPGMKIPIDENHAIDKAAPLGGSAPARGWIIALEARGDGLWGRVAWTREGQRLLSDKAYCGISPAIVHNKAGDILKVVRASLTNTPNLQGLTALHAAGQDTANLDDVDRFVMSLFSISESDYLAALDAGDEAEPSTFSDADRAIMQGLAISEGDYRTLIAGESAKGVT